MSTEARRASHPPRPTVPPRPAHPPEPARTGTERPEDPAGPRGRTSGGSGPFDPREPSRPPAGTPGEPASDVPPAPPHPPAGGPGVPRGRTSGGSGAFEIREAPRPPAGDTGRDGTGAGGAGSPAPRPRFPDFGDGAPAGTGPVAPPPPRASARFPDAPPAAGRGRRFPDGAPSVPPQPTARGTAPPPPETPSETTTRLRVVPPARPGTDGARRPGTAPTSGTRPDSGAGRSQADPAPAPDPALSWSSPPAPGGTPGAGRPVVSFGEPEGYDEGARPHPLGRRGRTQAVAAAACLVLGAGLIGGAVTGSWLAGDSDAPGARQGFAAARDMWHDVPVDQLFPPTLQGEGAGPGGADRSWTRIAVAPDSGCEDAFDALLRKVLAPVGCERLLRATYTDATQSHVTTVGLLFTEADAAGTASLARRFDAERLDRRTDMMPLPYAAKGTAAAGFGAGQRASWTISVLTDAPVVLYAVSGWADGRVVDTPQPAEDAMESTATTAPAQAGLGHEAQGLADRVERGLRKKAGTPTEQPS
ncbi:hypothetical protein ACH5AO_22270 [Streptomyces sp. NPDC018964]|uniref:hypothetical protein n=1 Tax=Streptomyces sp. NPDC018964 TaxID=3365058 RepID=UPI00378C490A